MSVASKTSAIRARSERYGYWWCQQHAATLMNTLQAQTPLEVRVYNGVDNKVVVLPVGQVIALIPRGGDGVPAPLPRTSTGQVVLHPTLHLSASIYHVLCAVVPAAATAARTA